MVSNTKLTIASTFVSNKFMIAVSHFWKKAGFEQSLPFYNKNPCLYKVYPDAVLKPCSVNE